MNTLATRIACAAVSGALTLGIVNFSSPAAAAVETPRAVVHVAPGETGDADGRAAIARRIADAADRVCSADAGADRFAVPTCRAHAVAAAERQLAVLTR